MDAKNARVGVLGPSVVVLMIDAFSRHGGLQAFNRRLAKNLAKLRERKEIRSLRVLSLRDPVSNQTTKSEWEIREFSSDRAAFLKEALISITRADVCLVCHINLVPIAALLKLVNPSLAIGMFAHGEEVWGEDRRRRRFYDNLALRHVTSIAAVSDYTSRKMQIRYPATKGRVILFPNVVDTATELDRKVHPSCQVLLVSRLDYADKRKNVDAVIEAIPYVLKAGLTLTLHIVGDGDLRSELEAAAEKLGVGNAVIFEGRICDGDLVALYSAADIFLLPSSKEGFGIVYLEAWLRGIPVICGREGAASELVEDGVDGIVVDGRSPAEIAGALISLLESSELRRKYGDAGRRKVLTYYNESVAYRNTAAFIRLLESNK